MGNTRRSSGTSEIPRPLISSDDSPAISSPRYVIDPERGGDAPTIDRIVVVFPAPLRPSSVTTSPSSISSETPWSTWLFP